MEFEGKYVLGDRLVIELISGEIYYGDFVRGNPERIEIMNVSDSRTELEGVFMFYKQEIKSVKLYKKNEKKMDILLTSSVPEDSANNFQTVTDQLERIGIEDDELTRLREVIRNYTYLSNFDERFYKACDILIKSETIGIAALGLSANRCSQISLLALSNWYNIYIVDLQFVNEKNFPKVLKDILETKYVTKVVFGATALIDSLFHKYGISLENIFDPQVVDLILLRRQKESLRSYKTLQECLTHYLQLPSSLLKDAMDVKLSEWRKRPLEEILTYHAAEVVGFLLILKFNMERSLLEDVYTTIDNVHKYYYLKDSYSFQVELKRADLPKDVSKLIPRLRSADFNVRPGDHSHHNNRLPSLPS